MDYETLAQSPILFLFNFIISLAITIVAYCIFPLTFAALRKTPISKKKYNIICFLINAVIMIMFFGPNIGAPYLLWTWCFTCLGHKILKKHGVLGTDVPSHSKSVSPPVITPDTAYASVNEPKSKIDNHIATVNSVSSVTNTLHNKNKVLYIVLSVILIVSILGNVFTIVLYNNSKQSCISLQQEISEKVKTIDELNGKLQTNTSTLDRKEREIQRIKKAKAKLQEKVDFMDRNVVIEANDGTHLYHSYDCPLLDLSNGFWIYNVEAAAHRGAHPCVFCQ